MKRAFMSELAIVRTLTPSIAGVGLFIFVVLTLANASDGDSGMSAGACAVSAMSPIMVMSSLAGFDNQNGWERYRATLPLTRKDIICARYPVHRCLLGHHGLRRRAFEHHRPSVLQQRGRGLDRTNHL